MELDLVPKVFTNSYRYIVAVAVPFINRYHIAVEKYLKIYGTLFYCYKNELSQGNRISGLRYLFHGYLIKGFLTIFVSQINLKLISKFLICMHC